MQRRRSTSIPARVFFSPLPGPICYQGMSDIWREPIEIVFPVILVDVILHLRLTKQHNDVDRTFPHYGVVALRDSYPMMTHTSTAERTTGVKCVHT